MRQKKFREQRRLLRRILARLDHPVDWMDRGQAYDMIYFCDRLVVDGRKLTASTRKIYLSALFAFMARQLAEQPEGVRLVVILREGNLLSSRATLFFDQAYEANFWNRQSPEQTWSIRDDAVTEVFGYPLPSSIPARLLIKKSGKTKTRLIVLG